MTSLHYQVHGSGVKKLVILHGLFGSGVRNLPKPQKLSNIIRDGFRILSSGLSPLTPETPPVGR